ncbi:MULTISPECIES: ABC transporter permease [Pedobacter]|jgi:putative ABC transport system permease protein|uniref:ABC transporter permease n=1 Tax=Pedobacter roseus TaxID=336820 RepID=A0A7G9QLI7_9SPHI|nr:MULTISPECIES: ABC transporter permease [Pedobacter]MBE5319388.1 ABC transporter permease [Pedobacter sp. MR2016-19]QNN44212.1 ABC transporter permease [Pedobacter roseus]QXU43849.1 ABC transporter permease [Pedobacter sp. D749]
MSIINLLKIAFRALKRNKLRAFLTMLGIIIGVAAVIAMMAIGEGSKQSIRSSLSGMGSNMITIMPQSNEPGGVRLQGSSIQTLKLEDITAIQKLQSKNINGLSPVVSTSGQAIKGGYNWPTTITGVSPDYLNIRQLKLQDGILFSENDVKSFAKVCLLGKTVIDNLFPDGSNPIGQIIRFKNIPFQVIGILEPKGQSNFGQDQDDIILAPFTTVQKRITATNYLQSIYASATTEASSAAATTEISDAIRESHRLTAAETDDFQVRTQAELISTISSTSSMLTVLLTAIAGISLFIGGIGIMNIMYVSVTERTREIGLRMSIGARGQDVLMQFLIEAILISITGGIIGVILGVSSAYLISYFLNWPILIAESSIIISFVVCAITGVFFGYYPAKKASNLDPIDALRYE